MWILLCKLERDDNFENDAYIFPKYLSPLLVSKDPDQKSS